MNPSCGDDSVARREAVRGSRHDNETVAHQTGLDRAGREAADVTIRRARLRRISSLGQRTGYGLYVGALVLGAICVRTSYTPALSTLIAVALIVGSMLLAPTIVMSHGIKAAEREERQAAALAGGGVRATDAEPGV